MIDWLLGFLPERPVEPRNEPDPQPECKHLNTIIYGSSPIMCGHCPDCGNDIPLYIVLNNWLQELRYSRHERPK